MPKLLHLDRTSFSSIAATEDPTQAGSCSRFSPNNCNTGSDSALLELAAVDVKWRLLRRPDDDDDVDDRVDLFRLSPETGAYEAGDGASDLKYLRITDEGFELVDSSCWREICWLELIKLQSTLP